MALAPSAVAKERSEARQRPADNRLISIDGLAECRALRELRLARNNISQISGLAGLPLKFLDLVGCPPS